LLHKILPARLRLWSASRMNPLTRRDFVKTAALTGVVATTAPMLSRAAPANASNPFQRSGRPRLMLSLAAYSFRTLFPTMRGKPNAKAPKSAAAMDMFKFVDYCAEHGCDGTELTSYFFAEETDDYLIKLRRHCFLRGVPISGTAIGNNFSHPKGAKRDEEIATTKKWIDRAALLGAVHIRVFAGVAPKGFARADADRMVISALEEVCDYAGQRGIFLGLENHDSIRNADTLLPMIKAVNSPWLGINLDSGNFHGGDPYQDFAACVPYALNIQVKAEIDSPAGDKVPADFKRITQILRDAGYQGWVALEYESAEDPSIAVPRHLRTLKALFAS
jgi:sugar phosphate isomerase/epimerase